MWRSRMLYLWTFCCIYLLKTSLSSPLCNSFYDSASNFVTNCSHRSLVSVPDSLPLDTRILQLNFNSLSSISFSSFKTLSQLNDLELTNNQIQNFEPDYPLSIKKLDLSSNSLTSVPNFSNLRQLTKLVLDQNKIPALPEGAFNDLPMLDELSIRGNAIQVVPEHIFDPLENLRYLLLSGNNIKKFPDNSLDNLEYLEKFDVSNNELRTIPQDFFENNLLPYVYLYNNPWHCECDTVEYLGEWIQSNDFNIYGSSGEADAESVICQTPSAWEATPIIHLPIEQICQGVTTTEILPQTSTVTEWVQVTTFNSHWLTTSLLEVCAQYRDLAGKVGTNCSHRSLVSVPDSLPLETEILLLDFNSLSAISLSSFKTLSNLYDIDLSNNQIQNFEPDYPLSIEKLDLSSNSLTSVPNFSNLRQLTKLVLDHNKIPALPEGAFNDLPMLDELSIRGNAIQVVPELIFDPLKNLRYLTLSGNNIKKFPDNSLDNLVKLTTFDVSNNDLRTIPQNFFKNNPLPYVYLYNNPWHCECDTVKYLGEWIQSNDFNIYGSSGEADAESVVCQTPSAWEETPIIQICQVVTTTEILPQTSTVTERLQVTTFNSHWLTTSPPLEVCAQYRDLAGKVGTNCSHRSLVSVPDSLPLVTEILLLNFNSLSAISLSSFKTLSNLYGIDLSNNQIQNFEPDYPLSIEKLDLSSNSLTNVPNLSNLRQLTKLVLDHNKIPALPEGAFNDLPMLDELSIRGNAIQVVPEHIFDPLKNLRNLTLSGNKIKKFPDNSLDNLEKLTTFDISNNDLRTIPQNFFENNRLPYVYLYNNPWHCECDTVKYLGEWIQSNDFNIYGSSGEADAESVICQTPSAWEETPIIYLPIEQICQVVTTTEILPQTSTVTEWLQVTTFNSHWLTTSPPLEVCAQYWDLAGKIGTNCSHRSLVSVPDSLPLETEILLLNFNSLSSISLSSFKTLSNLYGIDLSNNQIQSFEPDYPLSIEKLDLSSNSLTNVPNLSNLRHLTKLVLDHNKIPALPEGVFNDLPMLDELSIRGNAIQVVPEHIFDPLENLRYLILSGNNIKKFPDNSLDNLEKLRTFDVSNNDLRTIPQNFFAGSPELNVYLYNNLWYCDCNIQYLTEWIRMNEGKLYSSEGVPDDTDVLCSGPAGVIGWSLSHFATSNVCRTSTPDYMRLTSISSLDVTIQPDLLFTSAEDTVNLQERRSGLLDILSMFGSNCCLLFIVQCLSLGFLLLEICALLFYAIKIHRTCYAPLKHLAKRRFNIRLVRYSLLVPNLHQIYPALGPGVEPGGAEPAGNGELLDEALNSPSEGSGHPVGPMEASGNALGSFL